MKRPWQVPLGLRAHSFATREAAYEYAVKRIASVARMMPTKSYSGYIRNRETGQRIEIIVRDGAVVG